MHGEARQLYREMLEEGYDPNRGLGPVFVLIIVAGILAGVTALIAVTSFGGAVIDFFHSLPQLVPFS